MPVNRTHYQKILLIGFLTVVGLSASAQLYKQMVWNTDGKSYYRAENSGIVEYKMPMGVENVLVSARNLTPAGKFFPPGYPIFLLFFRFQKDTHLHQQQKSMAL